MNGTLASKIEFVELCGIFEKISKTDTRKSRISRKADILEQFFEKCRNMGRELKTEYPDMVKFGIFKLKLLMIICIKIIIFQ